MAYQMQKDAPAELQLVSKYEPDVFEVTFAARRAREAVRALSDMVVG